MSENDINKKQIQISFEDIDLPIPTSVLNLSFEKQKEIYEYLKEMDDIHKKAYLIAKNHLGTSFNIFKSNGYKEWKNSKTKP
jgi:hypothetical protein